MKKHSMRAFTLIELLIVVAIIAILAAIAIPNFLEAQTRSKVAKVKADMRTYVTAIESYQVEYNQAMPCAFFLPASYPNRDYYWYMWLETGHSPAQKTGAGRFLTSPVAYITSLPLDPFLTQRFGRPTSYTWFYEGKGKTRPASSNDAAQVGFGPHPGRDNAPYVLYGKRQYSWHMETFGPDLRYWLEPPYSVIYDPTNGSVSPGDIWYFNVMGFVGTGGR